MTTREAAGKARQAVADATVSVIGNAAGATVAPRTALEMLRSKVTSPKLLVLAGVVATAYLLGGWRARRSAARG